MIADGLRAPHLLRVIARFDWITLSDLVIALEIEDTKASRDALTSHLYRLVKCGELEASRPGPWRSYRVARRPSVRAND